MRFWTRSFWKKIMKTRNGETIFVIHVVVVDGEVVAAAVIVVFVLSYIFLELSILVLTFFIVNKGKF